MQENIPLTVESLSEEQRREFRITSARQIQSLLRDVMESRLPIALYYDGTRDFIMTSLLEVDDKGLWVEQCADKSKNRRIAESKRITLVCAPDQVKVQFTVSEVNAVTYQGYHAFYLPLTGNLYRLQYREYFRLMLPLSERLHCTIPLNKPPQAGKQIDIPIINISGGGIRLSFAEDDIELVLGQTYPGCQINLPEIGRINVTITVKNLVSISPKSGQIIKRAGCEFRDLDNISGILLQRYVTKMQRLRAAE